jgi:acyl-CoA oxidase
VLQVAAFRQRAAYTLLYVRDKLAQVQAGGVSPVAAWNLCCPDIIRASEAHCFYVLVRNFADAVKGLQATASPLAPVLGELRDLFALWWMQEGLGEFLESGFLDAAAGHVEFVRSAVRTRLSSVRPSAVPLCDAWGHSDHKLNSTLGRFDGKVYEALYESAQAHMNPMNKETVDPAFQDSVRHMCKAAKAKL